MRKRLGSVRCRSHGTDAKPACGIQDEVRAAPQEHRAARAPEPLHDARHIDEVALLPGVERIEKGPYVLADLGYGFLVEALERSLLASHIRRDGLEDLAIVDVRNRP
jgi:hypothetical protein